MVNRISARTGAVALTLAMVIIVGAAAVAPAGAQSRTTQALLNRIEQLEKRLLDMERQFLQGSPPSAASPGAPVPAPPASGQLAQAEIRMQALETELRRLTGQVEQAEFQVRQLADRVEKLIVDVDFRLKELEQAVSDQPAVGTAPAAAAIPPVGAAMAGATPPAATTETSTDQGQATASASVASSTTAPAPAAVRQSILPEGTPMERYHFAFALVRKSSFDDAEQAFQEFIAAHPDDPLSANARYWLGETYYVRERYDEAARAFLEGYQQFPKSAKAPDSLLKLGLTLRKLGQADESCAALSELLQQFPDAGQHLRDKARHERQQAGCS